MDAVDGAPGIVLYTIVDRELAGLIDQRCREIGVPCVSVLDPIIELFQSYLGSPSRRRSGAQHVMDAEYFARIEALNFTMDHDDGQIPSDFNEADVVLVGVSRTSKTPTSIYLANRGIKTANIPIVPGVPLPDALRRRRNHSSSGLSLRPSVSPRCASIACSERRRASTGKTIPIGRRSPRSLNMPARFARATTGR